jgi:hypothetical protein
LNLGKETVDLILSKEPVDRWLGRSFVGHVEGRKEKDLGRRSLSLYAAGHRWRARNARTSTSLPQIGQRTSAMSTKSELNVAQVSPKGVLQPIFSQALRADVFHSDESHRRVGDRRTERGMVTRVLVADDQHAVRVLVRTYLATAFSELVVAGEAFEGAQAVTMCELL